MKLYDIHTHIVFGVDDGSRSIEESIEMIKQYIDSGFSGIIATSHYDKGRYLATKDKVLNGVEKIKEELERQNIDFEIYPGNEIQIDTDTIKDINDGKVMRLNNSRYVLCELPFLTKPNYAENLFYEMQLNGWVPIIAHAERYSYVQEDPEYLLPFIKSGCLVQMNLSSLNRPDSRDVSYKLLERNMVHLLGTDAHQSKWRSPEVKEEIEKIKTIISEEKFELLLSTNPRKVIDNKKISSDYNEIRQEKKDNLKSDKKDRKWFKFW